MNLKLRRKFEFYYGSHVQRAATPLYFYQIQNYQPQHKA